MLGELGERVRPDRARHEVDADVEVMTVHRDASMYAADPRGHLGPLLRLVHARDLHDALRLPAPREPAADLRLLPLQQARPAHAGGDRVPAALRAGRLPRLDDRAPAAVLRRPRLLLRLPDDDGRHGVPGAAPAGPADAPPAYVDVPPEDVPPGATVYKHSDPAVRRRSFERNVGDALALLETYRTQHRRIVTSRLHCYLPVRSIGMDVEFRPHNRADVRFDGLMDIDDAAFAAIRDGMLERLERVHAAILSGAPEEDVYAPVARSRRRRRARRRGAPRAPAGAARARSRARRGRRPRGRRDRPHRRGRRATRVHVAVALPARAPAGSSPRSCTRCSSTRAGRCTCGSSPAPATRARERLVARFPELAISWVPLRGIRPKLLRLQLPALLPGVHRVVLLPLPSVATGDVAELADLDLRGHAFAAPLRPGTQRDQRLRRAPRARATGSATGPRSPPSCGARAHARHALRLRRVHDRRARRRPARLREAPLLAVADAYGLDDRETLHWLAGPDRATVPARWAAVPTRMPERGPGLIHWAAADGKGVPAATTAATPGPHAAIAEAPVLRRHPAPRRTVPSGSRGARSQANARQRSRSRSAAGASGSGAVAVKRSAPPPRATSTRHVAHLARRPDRPRRARAPRRAARAACRAARPRPRPATLDLRRPARQPGEPARAALLEPSSSSSRTAFTRGRRAPSASAAAITSAQWRRKPSTSCRAGGRRAPPRSSARPARASAAAPPPAPRGPRRRRRARRSRRPRR